jgi:predicted phosphate transport protein (TIGR00153 family)
MNIDKVLKFFVPKDHSFYPLFEEDAKNLVKAAELLRQLMLSSDIADFERIHKEIVAVEHIGDEITDKTYIQLNKSFITPFDREDIHELIGHIDDVVDSINGISRRILLYKPKKLMPVYKEMFKDIEHRADDYYFVAISELFEKEKDAAELMKNNKILEILERCVDEEEDITDVIKSILIKMA